MIAADPFPTGWEAWEPDPLVAAPRPARRRSRRLRSAGSPTLLGLLAAGIASAETAPAATTTAPTQVATTRPSLNVSADSYPP